MQLGRIGIFALAAALAGCASRELVLVPDVPAAPQAAASQPAAGRIGYYVPVQSRNLVVRAPDGTETRPFRDLEAAYRQMLVQVYGDVVRIDSLTQTDTMRVAGVRYVVAPEVSMSLLPSGPLGSTATVEITSNIRCASGSLVASPQAVGQSTTGISESVAGAGAVGRRAMSEALEKTQAALIGIKLGAGESAEGCAVVAQ